MASPLLAQIETDLGTFVNSTHGFGVEVIIGGVTIDAVYEDPYIRELDISGTAPVLICKTSDVESYLSGESVQIGTDYFRIASNEPDGTGMSRVMLEDV